MTLYKKTEEKELFTQLIPEIHSIKESFEIADMKGSKIESDIIDCINNEIKNITDDIELNNLSKRLKKDKYKKYIKRIENKGLQRKIKKCILGILNKIERFEKEYLEKI